MPTRDLLRRPGRRAFVTRLGLATGALALGACDDDSSPGGSDGGGPPPGRDGGGPPLDADGDGGAPPPDRDSGPPPPLPAWVPATLGEAALVPMRNALDDVDLDGVWSGASAANFADYSGGIYNPHYGTWGAHVIHGGGHAGSNDNSVFIASYETLRFERVGGPTEHASDAEYEEAIARGEFPDDESNPREVEPGVPGSAHTYDCLLVLPPEVVGDPLGALIRPVSSAVGRGVSRSSGWAHVFTFTDRRWTRWSTNFARSWGPGGTCALDTMRGRIWPVSDGNAPYRAYLTLADRTFTNLDEHRGLGTYPDMVHSAYCAHRDVVVIASNAETDTEERFFWFDAASTGLERTPVTFARGALPPANWGRGSLMYVPELERLVWWSAGEPDSYFEIDVPETPNEPWSFVARTITGAARPSTLSPPPTTSVYRRMDYSSKLRSIVWVTGQEQNTFRFGGRIVCVRIA